MSLSGRESEDEMTQQELIEKYCILLNEECGNYDTELAHINADNILCALLKELGLEKVVIAFCQVSKWYA